ncbi:MAG TPA: hypothetical protein PLO24_13320, partial [Bacteroidales bacterium]|nr:hypothetical protein [Bacteroidales bacterium]
NNFLKNNRVRPAVNGLSDGKPKKSWKTPGENLMVKPVVNGLRDGRFLNNKLKEKLQLKSVII